MADDPVTLRKIDASEVAALITEAYADDGSFSPAEIQRIQEAGLTAEGVVLIEQSLKDAGSPGIVTDEEMVDYITADLFELGAILREQPPLLRRLHALHLIDFEVVSREISQAYANDGKFDDEEQKRLVELGLHPDQVAIVQDTLTDEASPGIVTGQERQRYRSNGLSELGRLLQAHPPIQQRYEILTGSPFSPDRKRFHRVIATPLVAGFARFVGHDPVNLEGAYPNDTMFIYGADLAVDLQVNTAGWGAARPVGWFLGRGPIHVRFLYGKSTDSFQPKRDLPLDESLRNLLGDEKFERHSQSAMGFIIREFELQPLAPDLHPRIRALAPFATLGMGFLYNRTAVKKPDGTEHLRSWDPLGRFSLGMHALEVRTGPLSVGVYGELALMGGSQVGVDGTGGFTIKY